MSQAALRIFDETPGDYLGNKTTVGLLKAAIRIAEQNKRLATQPPKKPKYIYVDGGTELRATRCLKKEERRLFEDTKKKLRNAKTRDEIEEARAVLVTLPLRSVRVKRALLQDYSKDYSAQAA